MCHLSLTGEITTQGEKSTYGVPSAVSAEVALPGEVKELLREVIQGKKESDQTDVRTDASAIGKNIQKE